jgi:cob(I)alamin adenosyltransferase
MMTLARFEDEAAVAIGAFHEILVAHFQIDARMSQRAAAAVAGHAGRVNFNHFGHFHRHEALYILGSDLGGRDHSLYDLARKRISGVSAVVRLNKIYTKTGDAGQTGLTDGSRVAKSSLRVAAMGAVDETSSAIGIARLDAEGDRDAMLARIQNDLFDLGADLSMPGEGSGDLRIVPAQVERLEREIDAMNEGLSPLTSFILPGGTGLAAHLHLARAIARRAECVMVALAAAEPVTPAALQYANRLSDHLFVMARAANDAGMGDVLWVPGKNR